MLSQVPMYKLITPAVVSERLKVRVSLAKLALKELLDKSAFVFSVFLLKASLRCRSDQAGRTAFGAASVHARDEGRRGRGRMNIAEPNVTSLLITPKCPPCSMLPK